MTVTTQFNYNGYTGDGSTLQFNFTFKTLDEATVGVVEDNQIRTDFDVTLNPNQNSSPGGSVTFTGPAPANGILGVIFRTLDVVQDAQYTPYDRFPAEAHELALDKQVMMMQQLEERIGRSIKKPPNGHELGSIFLPDYANGQVIGWGKGLGDENILVNYVLPSGAGGGASINGLTDFDLSTSTDGTISIDPREAAIHGVRITGGTDVWLGEVAGANTLTYQVGMIFRNQTGSPMPLHSGLTSGTMLVSGLTTVPTGLSYGRMTRADGAVIVSLAPLTVL